VIHLFVSQTMSMSESNSENLILKMTSLLTIDMEKKTL